MAPTRALPAAYPLLEVEQAGPALLVRFKTDRLISEGVVYCIAWELDRLLAEGGCHRCVLNFQAVQGMDSLMLSKLLGLRRKVHALGGRLTLCGVGPSLMPWFERTRLAQVFEICADEQEALRA